MKTMTRTTLFQSNRTQAVRLPKAVAFPEGTNEVVILIDGNTRILIPSEALWDDFFAAEGIVLGPRQQPATQQRETF